jgi:hypothetical protein
MLSDDLGEPIYVKFDSFFLLAKKALHLLCF